MKRFEVKSYGFSPKPLYLKELQQFWLDGRFAGLLNFPKLGGWRNRLVTPRANM
jgi:hypothetical protein